MMNACLMQSQIMGDFFKAIPPVKLHPVHISIFVYIIRQLQIDKIICKALENLQSMLQGEKKCQRLYNLTGQMS